MINFEFLLSIDGVSLIASVCSILTTIAAVVKYWSNTQKNKPEKEFKYRSWVGYILLPILFILTIILLYNIFFDTLNNYVIWSWAVTLICCIILGVCAYNSFSQTIVFEPEWFWRLLLNQLKTRYEDSSKSKISVLILYANDCKDKFETIQAEYTDENSPLNIVGLECSNEIDIELSNKLLNDNYFGIYLLLSKNISEWVIDDCEKWSNQHKDRPIVYTNLTNSNAVRLHFGKVSKSQYKYGVLRLLERTYQRADLWEQQSKWYWRACCVIITFFVALLLVFHFNLNSIKENYDSIKEEYATTKIDELVKYDSDFYGENSNGYTYAKDLREKIFNKLDRGCLKQTPTNHILSYHAKQTIERIIKVNKLSDKKEEDFRLTFWKIYNDSVCAVVWSDVNDPDKTNWVIGNERSVIASACNEPNTFIVQQKQQNSWVRNKYKLSCDNKKMGTIQVADNRDQVVSFTETPDSKNAKIIIAFCLYSKNFNDITAVNIEINFDVPDIILSLINIFKLNYLKTC